MPQVVQPIVEKVKVQDVLSRDSARKKPLDNLEQVCRLAATAYADTYGGLAANRFYAQAPGHPALQFRFLKIQEDGLDRLFHGVIPGNIYFRYVLKPVTNIAGFARSCQEQLPDLPSVLHGDGVQYQPGKLLFFGRNALKCLRVKSRFRITSDVLKRFMMWRAPDER